MGKRCIVPKCKSGCRTSSEKVSIFKIPKGKLEMWQKVIPRKDRPLTYRDSVCEKHFQKEDVIRVVTTPAITYNLKVPKLASDAIPSIFTNCPKSEFPTQFTEIDSPVDKRPKKILIRKVSPKSIKFFKRKAAVLDFEKNRRTEFMKRIEENRRKFHNMMHLTKEQYDKCIECVFKAISSGLKSDILKTYDVIDIDGVIKLTGPIRKNKNIQLYVSDEELFDLFNEAHVSLKHAGRLRMIQALKESYINIASRDVIIYLDFCVSCLSKRRYSVPRSLPYIAPIQYDNKLSSNCDINIIHHQLQPDDDYKFILLYQNHLTKFCLLKALKSKSLDEITSCLYDIFTFIGVPATVYSEITKELFKELTKKLPLRWPNIKINHVKCEKNNEIIERVIDGIQTWMERKQTNDWSQGLRFVQLSINQDFHDGLNTTPYNALLDVFSDDEEEQESSISVKEEPLEIFNNVCEICLNDLGNEESCSVCETKPVIKSEDFL